MTKEQERLATLAREVRDGGRLGQSDVVNRVFDFLLAQSLAGRSPKEAEIAFEVFGKDSAFDAAQDASIRVHIHRLRKKLEDVALNAEGERLSIPRGEYRLTLLSPHAEVEEPIVEESQAAPPAVQPTNSAQGGRGSLRLGIGMALLLLAGMAIGAGGWSLYSHRPDSRLLTSLWRPLLGSDRPTLLLTGDYYVLGEAPDGRQVSRLVREFSINSREDLDQYLMAHPDQRGHYVDLGLRYLPISTSNALRELLPLINNMGLKIADGRPVIIPSSRLTVEVLRNANIIYVGDLSGLGMIRQPLFAASGFTIGNSYDELIDRTTGKKYQSDWDEAANNSSPRREFAYVASLPGAQGNRIVVIAGTGDAAATQAAEIATDKGQLDRITAEVGNKPAFEALYEVRTLGSINLDSRPVLIRPLMTDRLWRPDGPPPSVPDALSRRFTRPADQN